MMSYKQKIDDCFLATIVYSIMSKIINFTEVQTKKLEEERATLEILKNLSIILQNENALNILKLICRLTEELRENEKFLSSAIKLIATETELKTSIEYILKTLSFEDKEKILAILEASWPKEADTVNRLRHILKLSHFCSKQVPKLPFFHIIPRSIVMKFLLAEKTKL